MQRAVLYLLILSGFGMIGSAHCLAFAAGSNPQTQTSAITHPSATATVLATEPPSASPLGSPSPTASSSPFPSATPSGVELIKVPSLESQASITAAEVTKLRKDFREMLRERMKLLDRDQRQIRKNSEASRAQAFDDWSKRETQARRNYFEEHPKGAERRVYMKDLIERRKAQVAALAEEEKRATDEHKVRKKSVEMDHSDRFKEFDRYLKAGRRPPESLWGF